MQHCQYITSLYSDKLFLPTVSTLFLAENTGRGIPVVNNNFSQYTKYGTRGSCRIYIRIFSKTKMDLVVFVRGSPALFTLKFMI